MFRVSWIEEAAWEETVEGKVGEPTRESEPLEARQKTS